MALTRYTLILAQTRSRFHVSASTLQARDLAAAEGHATRALRALRLTHDQGPAWDRWVLRTLTGRAGLPETVAVGGANGTEWSARFERGGGAHGAGQ